MFLHLPKAISPEETVVWVEVRMARLDKKKTPYYKELHNVRADLLLDQGGWIEIDLRDMVAHWLKNPHENFGLTLSVASANGHTISVGIQNQQSEYVSTYIFIKNQLSSSI